jgi:transcriptional regulator with XRE-family HTH domain
MQPKTFDMKAFGKRLRQLRKEQGLSQADLGEAIGVNQSWISELEHGGQNDVQANTLLLLCHALRVSTDALLGLAPSTPRRRGRKEETRNSTALALLAQWYATPDDQPPGYWDDLEDAIMSHPIQFNDEDTNV